MSQSPAFFLGYGHIVIICTFAAQRFLGSHDNELTFGIIVEQIRIEVLGGQSHSIFDGLLPYLEADFLAHFSLGREISEANGSRVLIIFATAQGPDVLPTIIRIGKPFKRQGKVFPILDSPEIGGFQGRHLHHLEAGDGIFRAPEHHILVRLARKFFSPLAISIPNRGRNRTKSC